MLEWDDTEELRAVVDGYDFIPADDVSTYVIECDGFKPNIEYIENILEKQNLNIRKTGFSHNGWGLQFENEYQLICFKMFFDPSDGIKKNRD